MSGLSRTPDFSLKPGERSRYGVTVTVVRVDVDPIETRAWHIWDRTSGLALQAVIERCDRWEGDWRIATYSNPATIQRDMWGTRHVTTGFKSGAVSSGERNGYKLDVPEEKLLAAAGRLDLWLSPYEHRSLRGEQAVAA